MSYDVARLHILNGVATIEIARPEKKNALTAAMYQGHGRCAFGTQRSRDAGSARRADHRTTGYLHERATTSKIS